MSGNYTIKKNTSPRNVQEYAQTESRLEDNQNKPQDNKLVVRETAAQNEPQVQENENNDPSLNQPDSQQIIENIPTEERKEALRQDLKQKQEDVEDQLVYQKGERLDLMKKKKR